MAVTRSVLEKEAWNARAWPNRLPPADTLTVLYGENADELVIQFLSAPARDIVVIFIDTPDIDYAGMLVRMDTGDVVGVYVNYLAIYAVSQHPTWQSMTNRCPNPADALLVVADIKEPFERNGIGDHVDSKRA